MDEDGSSLLRDLRAQFAAAMERLGPFEPRPRLAVAVSGGADSTTLTLLADGWVRHVGGSLLALIVDHGLRPESAVEAALTADRLNRRGIPVRQLRAVGLRPGTAIAERARAARYALLAEACAGENILHLLLGHHAADQAETVMIRVLGQSADRGLAGMPALIETGTLRLLRPLLAIQPDRLRKYLILVGMPWVEDPSNRDPTALRARLRLLRGIGDLGVGTRAVVAASVSSGQQRGTSDRSTAAVLADQVTLRPEGFAILAPRPIAAEALAALLQVIGGAPYPPRSDQIRALAAHPHPTTLAGVRLLPAGRLGPGLLVVREPNAMSPPIAARPGILWDRRYRLASGETVPEGAMIGALGDDAARLRHCSELPAAVLYTIPAVRIGKNVEVVPHLLYPDPIVCGRVRLIFNPPGPLSGAPFCPVTLPP